MIRYIVDGHNLINSVPRYREILDRDYGTALKTLYGDLELYVQAKSVVITLVFDGNPPWEPPEDSHRLSAVFSGESRSADTVVMENAEKHQGGQSTVVTRDRKILRTVAELGCHTLSPSKFARLFARSGKEKKEKPCTGDEKLGHLTPSQVKWWKAEMKKKASDRSQS